MSIPRIIVLDGHDGAGKSSLSALLAERFQARVIRPFQGVVAERFTEFVEQDRLVELDTFTRAVVGTALQEHRGASRLIFDRHWLTLYSLLPEDLWAGWEPRPPTLLCWADPEMTFRRVSARGERRRNSLEYHRLYCARFLEIGQRFDLPVLDTSETRLDQALELAMERLESLA